MLFLNQQLIFRIINRFIYQITPQVKLPINSKLEGMVDYQESTILHPLI